MQVGNYSVSFDGSPFLFLTFYWNLHNFGFCSHLQLVLMAFPNHMKC